MLFRCLLQQCQLDLPKGHAGAGMKPKDCSLLLKLRAATAGLSPKGHRPLMMSTTCWRLPSSPDPSLNPQQHLPTL